MIIFKYYYLLIAHLKLKYLKSQQDNADNVITFKFYIIRIIRQFTLILKVTKQNWNCWTTGCTF